MWHHGKICSTNYNDREIEKDERSQKSDAFKVSVTCGLIQKKIDRTGIERGNQWKHVCGTPTRFTWMSPYKLEFM